MIRSPIKITPKWVLIGFCLWTLWAMFYAIILSIGAHLLYVYALISGLMSYYPLAILSIFVIAFCKTFKIENYNIIWFITIHFFIALLFAAVWLVIDYAINLLLFGPIILEHRPLDSVGMFMYYNGILIYALIVGIFYASETYKQYREKELKTSQLQTLTREAELKALKSQINPHFLFNTLNTIFALIDSHKEKAKSTVTKLSDLLRYSLAGFYQEFVPLEKEIDSIKTYLAIEKARFGERLKVEYNIDPQILRSNVPPMSLQPLVENAVKHGISPTKQGGTITITAKRIADELEIKVTDTGKDHHAPEQSQAENNGIGLKNLQERLQRIYGDNFYFNAGPTKPNGFSVVLRFKMDATSESNN